MTTDYILESANEAARLDRQASMFQYRWQTELQGIEFDDMRQVIDAGTGSGIVAFELAAACPWLDVLGWDISAERIGHARARPSPGNLHFETADLRLAAPVQSSADLAICRYVLQHLSRNHGLAVLRNLRESLRPEGRIRVVDVDGMMGNLYPIGKDCMRAIQALNESGLINMTVGRGLPAMLKEAGYTNIRCALQNVLFQGAELAQEREQYAMRLAQAEPKLIEILGPVAAARFHERYLASLADPDGLLFYTKFIVDAERPVLS